MTKEIENKICVYCDSQYRLIYNLEETSGYAKVCPFCGSELDEEDKENDDTEKNRNDDF